MLPSQPPPDDRLQRVTVVRHACAGDKSVWDGPDDERPLDDVGLEQAEAVARLLAPRPVARLIASPTRRCVQTLEPLARRLDLPVETSPALGTGAGPDELLALLTAPEARHAVLCTHGEALVALAARLRATGASGPAWSGGDLLQKGVVWSLLAHVAEGEDHGTVSSLQVELPGDAPPCLVHPHAD